MSSLTIVMYHYVRKIKGSAYPEIKGLEIEGFNRQLDYFQEGYNFVGADEVLRAIKSPKHKLPRNACWLTFDDGYLDHYSNVFPELISRGISGSFFPPVSPIRDREMLDVNKIHFILASTTDKVALKNELLEACHARDIPDGVIMDYWNKYHRSSRYDNAEVVFIKRMLQTALPEDLRADITEQLFQKHVGMSEKEFADQFYMNKAQIGEMIDAGMHFGSHGFKHYWLNEITPDEQEIDLRKSLDFLEDLGLPPKDWVMCYPYGSYNEHTLRVLRDLDCAVGLTTNVATAEVPTTSPLTLPRYDTNDFPQ